MSPFLTADPAGLARGSADFTSSALRRIDEDAHLGFKYLLLRLTTVGLTSEDVSDLRDIALAAVGQGDISAAVARVLQRASSSSLAVAIAGSIGSAPESLHQDVIIDSVLAAHAAAANSLDQSAPVFAALVGAAMAQTRRMTVETAEKQGWKEFMHQE